MKNENKFPKRKHPRLPHYDYSAPGAYFITICTHEKRCFLSQIGGSDVETCTVTYSEFGKTAKEQLLLLEQRYPFLKIDQFVIMPNHIHILLVLQETAGASPRPTVSDIICAYKSLTTKACKKIAPIQKVFQTSFYEHVVRGHEDYCEIAKYIAENPAKWMLDRLNPQISIQE